MGQQDSTGEVGEAAFCLTREMTGGQCSRTEEQSRDSSAADGSAKLIIERRSLDIIQRHR